MEKILVFDMDGTIADLYNTPHWLMRLEKEDAGVYKEAAPIYNPDELNNLIKILKNKNWKVVIVTWGAIAATDEFNKRTIVNKMDWLKKVGFPFDEFYFQKYGTLKEKAVRHLTGKKILIDDNEKVRKDWEKAGMETIDATKDVLKKLKALIEMEV